MIRRRKKPAEASGINLTPVLGLAFILLLFIVAAVPFAQERGIYFRGGHDCEFPIFVSVDKQNRIFVEQGDAARPIDIRALRSSVARRLAENHACRIIIAAHKQSDMGTVVRVADEAKQAANPPVPVQIATVDD